MGESLTPGKPQKVLLGYTAIYPTLWDPVDCGPPGSSVHGILRGKILDRDVKGVRGKSHTRVKEDNPKETEKEVQRPCGGWNLLSGFREHQGSSHACSKVG